MDGIVIELQKEAINASVDVVTLLRKAYLVASKLKLDDFKEWLHNELNGYKDINKVPEYRKVRGEVRAYNPARGWIPVILQESSKIEIHSLVESVSNLLELCKLDEKFAIVKFNPQANKYLSQSCGVTTSYALQISNNYIRDVAEIVKNRILEWALMLEENGIIGDGLRFSEDEINKANQAGEIKNYINNFYSPVNDASIQQG